MLARVIYGEARGESDNGRIAVGNVIINRAKNKSIKDVIMQSKQFSCLNPNDKNFQVISEPEINDSDMVECRKIADMLLSGRIMDNTRGSMFYHEKSVKPYWAKNKTVKRKIGRHRFYR